MSVHSLFFFPISIFNPCFAWRHEWMIQDPTQKVSSSPFVVIQQLCGSNLTQFWPPPPAHPKLWIFLKIIATLCNVTHRGGHFPLTPTLLVHVVIEWPLLGFAKSFEWLWNPTKLFVKVHTYRMYLEHSRNWTLEHYQNWSALPLPTMYPTKWVQLSCRNRIVLTSYFSLQLRRPAASIILKGKSKKLQHSWWKLLIFERFKFATFDQLIFFLFDKYF